MASSDTGKIAFIPLEANPELMNSLLHRIGLKQELAMHDVYSITEPELLAFIPRPAYALLLVFPISAAYESFRLAEDATFTEYKGKGEAEPVVWFKQTIRNACGLMGLLHAVSNGPARREVGETLPFLFLCLFFFPPFFLLLPLCCFCCCRRRRRLHCLTQRPARQNPTPILTSSSSKPSTSTPYNALSSSRPHNPSRVPTTLPPVKGTLRRPMRPMMSTYTTCAS